METSPRRKRPEQICASNTIQDGNHTVGYQFPEGRRLDGVPRSPGRILSCTYPSEIKEIPTVCVQRQGFSIQGSLLRPINSPTSFHKDDGSNCEMASLRGNSHFPLPRRLADPVSVKRPMHEGPTKDPFSYRRIGTHSKSSKVTTLSISRLDLFGSSDELSSFSGFSDVSKDREMPAESEIPDGSQDLFCQGMDEPFRHPLIARDVRQSGEATHETSSVLPTADLEQEERHGFVCFSSIHSSKARPVMVERQEQTRSRFVTETEEPRPDVVLRRFRRGLGSNIGGSSSVRQLVFIPTGLAHKCERVEGNTSSLGIFRASGGKQKDSSALGQLHSSGVREETRRHSLLLSVRDRKRPAFVGGNQEHRASNSLHPGSSQRKSGYPQQVTPGHSDGMDPPPESLPRPVEGLGNSHVRPVRNEGKPQTTSLLLSCSRPGSISGGCHAPGLVGSLPLCFPSLQDAGRSPEKVSSTQRCVNDPYSSMVARKIMVSRATGESSGLAKEVAIQTRPSVPVAQQKVPQEPVRSKSDRVQTLERLYRRRGFSRRVAQAMARSTRPSSTKVYQAKWKRFREWCSESGVSSTSTTLSQVADFLLFLHKEKKLAVSTIKGYRSMLAAIFRNRGIDLSSDKDIAELLKSFATTKGKSLRVPHWNLDVVLKWLTSKSFEPLSSCSVRNLTKKTLFLLALASAKRVSEIHALDKRVGFCADKAVVSFTLGFLAKNENPSNPWPREFPIPSLSSLSGRETERLLCPVRALKFYLDRTRSVRGTHDFLWCSTKNPKNPLSKNGIAFLLKELIQEAHKELRDVDFPLVKVRPHEIRAIATSLAFKKNMALKDILSSTYWRCSSVFASHYLRQIQTTYEDCSTLGPFIASDTVMGKETRGSRSSP